MNVRNHEELIGRNEDDIPEVDEMSLADSLRLKIPENSDSMQVNAILYNTLEPFSINVAFAHGAYHKPEHRLSAFLPLLNTSQVKTLQADQSHKQKGKNWSVKSKAVKFTIFALKLTTSLKYGYNDFSSDFAHSKGY